MRPTWKVVGVEPIFTVADIDDSVSHYERLGFTTSRRNTTYAFAHRDRLVIHLAQADRESPRAIGSIYLHVDDADVLADEWRRAGLNVVGSNDCDYSKREGSHRDPDGNVLRFGSPLRPRRLN